MNKSQILTIKKENNYSFKIKESNNKIIRTMMSGKTPKALKYLAHMPQSNSTSLLRSAYTRYYAKYSVYDTRVNNQSYENIQKGFKYTYSDEDLYMDVHHIIYYNRYVNSEEL